MKYCHMCGARMEDSQRFCIKCGTKSSDTAPAKAPIITTYATSEHPTPTARPAAKTKKPLGIMHLSIIVLSCAAALLALLVGIDLSRNPIEPANNGGSSFDPVSIPEQMNLSPKAQEYIEFGAQLMQVINSYELDGDISDPFRTCRLLVFCNGNVDMESLGADVVLKDPDGMYVLQFDTAMSAESAYIRLSRLDGIESVEPDYIIEVNETDEQSYPASNNALSWGVAAIGADVFAEALAQTDYKSVCVAVVDSGVSEHSFIGSRLLSGWDYVECDADPSDKYGHGTHVAGTIVDCTPGLDVNILPVRVLGKRGGGLASIIGLGIKFAAENGADVINLSLGKSLDIFPLSAIHKTAIGKAVTYAVSKGVIVVASAGNDSRNAKMQTPACIPECITVSALDSSLCFAESFSNFGSVIDFAAPGYDIYSCVPGGYKSMNGTSMAAPHISALAAMLKAAGLADSGDEVTKLLSSTCIDLGDEGKDNKYGYGLPQMQLLVHMIAPEDSFTQELFNETCWEWIGGPTLASRRVLKFHLDGTVEIIKSGSLEYSVSTYEFSDGVLTFENVEYDLNTNGDRFTFSSQNGYYNAMEQREIHYSIIPADPSYWDMQYEKSIDMHGAH